MLGPSLLPGGFPSADFVLGYFNPARTEVPVGFIGVVDVRDVSKIHLEAIRRPDAAGHRFIAYSERAQHYETAERLDAEFAPKGFNVCTKKAEGTPERDALTTAKTTREFFGIDFISAKDALIAMANSLIEHGVLKPTQ